MNKHFVCLLVMVFLHEFRAPYGVNPQGGVLCFPTWESFCSCCYGWRMWILKKCMNVKKCDLMYNLLCFYFTYVCNFSFCMLYQGPKLCFCIMLVCMCSFCDKELWTNLYAIDTAKIKQYLLLTCKLEICCVSNNSLLRYITLIHFDEILSINSLLFLNFRFCHTIYHEIMSHHMPRNFFIYNGKIRSLIIIIFMIIY